jgi:hypothetical protein
VSVGNQTEAIALVEIDGPGSLGRCTDQYRLISKRFNVPQKLRADSFPLNVGGHICVTDQSDGSLVLKPNYALQLPILLGHPENDPGSNLERQFLFRHIRIVPPIGRNHAAVGLCRVIDDYEYLRLVRTRSLPNSHRTLPAYRQLNVTPPDVVPLSPTFAFGFRLRSATADKSAGSCERLMIAPAAVGCKRLLAGHLPLLMNVCPTADALDLATVTGFWISLIWKIQ